MGELSAIRCAACASPLRHEIDQKLSSGATTKHVSDWLASRKVYLPAGLLALHHGSHSKYPPTYEGEIVGSVRARVAAEPSVETGFVANEAALNEAAGIAMGVLRAYKERAEDGDLTMPETLLFAACLKEVRSAVVDRQRLIKDGGGSGATGKHITGVADLLAFGFKGAIHAKGVK